MKTKRDKQRRLKEAQNINYKHRRLGIMMHHVNGKPAALPIVLKPYRCK